MTNYNAIIAMTERNREKSRRERIGKIYGDFEVIDVTFECKKQIWVMKCLKCGEEKTIKNGREFHKDYVKGKNKSKCTYQKRQIKEQRKKEGELRKKQKEEREKQFAESKKIKKIEKDRKMAKIQEILNSRIGERFAYLTCEKKLDKGYLFRCDCGRMIKDSYYHIKKGNYKTCGSKECEYHNKIVNEAIKHITKHGDCSSNSEYHYLYKVYQGMINRCYNKKSTSYPNYGGRGITICEEWLSDYEKFKEWAITNDWKYERGENGINIWSIDRIDVNGNYEPDNCQWTTAEVQRKNQRPRKGKIEIDGIIKTKKEWCEQYGITNVAVNYRIKNFGMTFETAVKAPKFQGNHIY